MAMKLQQGKMKSNSGFTIPEIIIAGVILIIIGVGTAQTFVFATRMNRGNNLRMQALSVLQQEVEYYRSLKFVPGLETDLDLPNHRVAELYAGSHTRPTRTSATDRVFNITVNVVNLTPSTEERLVRFKRITITATPVVAENEGWLQDLNTNVTVERVRSN
jgi:type II secretory pathway pseudopilin PulG